MRLIDADELLEAIDNQDNWLGQMDISQMAGINIYSLVNTMPTVEARPKGEWITKNEYTHDCNLCGCSMLDTWNFCPNCGADMRGGRE